MEKNKARALIIVIINIFLVKGFDIIDHRDVGDLRNPVRTDSAQPVDLECGLRFNPGSDEKWTTCKWTKIFRDIPADWTSSQYAYIMCSTTSVKDNGQTCEDQGNINEYWSTPAQNPHTQYDTSRLQYRVDDDSCGLTINRPHANDTGEWICHVTDNSPNTEPVTMRSSVRVFTAQKSVINVTKPNMQSDPNYSINVDFGDRINQDIETIECTASGIPTPEIFWYIDDPKNRIESSAYTSREVIEGEYTVKVVSTLSRLTLDRTNLERYGIRGSQSSSHFAFAVGCYAEQPRYFEFADDPAVRHPAEVLVFGSSGGARLGSPAGLGVIILLSVLQHYF